jgi:hypothetical protein
VSGGFSKTISLPKNNYRIIMKYNLLKTSLLSLLVLLSGSIAIGAILSRDQLPQKVEAADGFKDFSVIVNNQEGTLLTAEEQVQGTDVNFGVAVDSEGNTVRVAADAGNAVATVSGKYHSEHGCTGLQVVVPVSGAVTIQVGQCTYSSSDITVTDGEGNIVATATPETACWKNDRSNVTELVYKGGAATLTIKGMQYCPFVAVKALVVNPMKEKNLYTTDFAEWTAIKASADETTVAVETKYTHETLNFTISGTAMLATDDSKFANYTELPHNTLRADKNADAYIMTSALASISKVRYVHAATGSSRGWKLEAKGDGDADWVLISDSYANPAGWCVVEKEVNKTNVQLRWTNLNKSQNAYMFELDIYGMVDMSGTPALGSFKANGEEYELGEAFEENAQGDMEATVELSKKAAMVSAANPLTDITADNGEIGTVVYEGTETSCKVTIPVTASGKTVNFIVNFVQKPDFTLTYVNTDGQAMGTQKVEKDAAIGSFEVSIGQAASSEGKKARGWFKNNYVGAKYTVDDVVTENISLYAIETEIEGPSDSKKYVFDLTDRFFYAEDHEAFNPVGSGRYYNNHGWVFGAGDKIELLVGKKASVMLYLCAYSSDTRIEASNGASVPAKVDTDGGMESLSYEGEEGTLTLTFNGTTYVHGVTILNTTTTNYEREGNKFIVKQGDASSFTDALDAANGVSGTDNLIVYLPNGTYDLGNACLTTVGRDNITILGESQTGVVIQNLPTAEGIGVTATLYNTSNYLTLEKLTLKNAYPYYDPNTGKASAFAGRAVCLQDRGNYTVCRNVTMLSYQDTYYSCNNNAQLYFVDCDIHGLVDFVCGGGDVFFDNTTFTLESREMTEGKGDVTIAAPNGARQYGYVMSGCTVDCHSATFNWGRSWGHVANLAWVNTTLKQPGKIKESRFTTAGMNCAADGFFEYGTKDLNGNVVSPASNILEFTHTSGNKKYETILTDEQAAQYTKENVFVDAPDEFKARVGIKEIPDCIQTVRTLRTADAAIYNMQGIRVAKPVRGLNIVDGKKVVVR